MLNRIADLWCKKMHTGAMWPIHGKYICPRCLREHAVNWEVAYSAQHQTDPSLQHSRVAIATRVLVH